jgi:dTDP-4-dehydrorhamnose reductase
MQTVLLTGANGFVGSYLVKQLLDKNYKVIATGKGNCRLNINHQNFFWDTLDFTSKSDVATCFEKHKPHVVVHTGALSKPDECEVNREEAYFVNVIGTKNLLETAQDIDSFFIFLSTDFIFSGERGMYNEDDATGPVNYYGQTKLEGEKEVKKYKGNWSIVRTVLVYGDPMGGRENILTNVAKALHKENPLKIFNDQVRTPTYVEDLISAIVSVIEKGATGVFHISGEDVLTPYEMAIAVADHLQLNSSLISAVTEDAFEQPARRPLKTGFNITKAKKELNYTPTSFSEGLKKTFKSR